MHISNPKSIPYPVELKISSPGLPKPIEHSLALPVDNGRVYVNITINIANLPVNAPGKIVAEGIIQCDPPVKWVDELDVQFKV
ncbi:MAG: hypothetical protein L0213_10010 [Candidatus Dadabacteria bacterium]|nr:hypothetical protein [Candidatus Dadabacteria bacterium]